jgi:murein L,D-transpeptidase YcbB/YkuD
MHPAALALALLGPAGLAAPAATELPASLQARLAAGRSPELRHPDWSGHRSHATAFYQRLGGKLAWVAGGAPTPQAREAMARLAGADLKGLNAADYDGDRWPARAAALAAGGEVAQEAFDVALTVCLLRYASDLNMGRVDPAKLGQAFGKPAHRIVLADFAADLAQAPDPGARLEGLEPNVLPYRTLRSHLPRYLELARRPQAKLPPARNLAPGAPYAGSAALAELLVALGDLAPEAAKALPPGRYDPVLAKAVEAFQVRHGLDHSGKLGPRTLAELNTPLSHRLAQIRLTLERWRWLSLELGPRQVEVNLPAFNLSALTRTGDTVHTDLWMRVVVGGELKHETHVLTGTLATVVFRPYWNVPPSIVKSDILPALRKRPSYLARNGYELVHYYEDPKGALPVNGANLRALAAGRLQLRQKPGPTNALGRVKLLFPNSQGIYLHDTPSRSGFEASQRALSHGCVRVEHAAELVAWVLRDDPAWPLDKVQAAMAGDAPPQTVAVGAPVQVLFVYGTATVDGSGRIYFYPDLYGNDADLQKALDQAP